MRPILPPQRGRLLRRNRSNTPMARPLEAAGEAEGRVYHNSGACRSRRRPHVVRLGREPKRQARSHRGADPESGPTRQHRLGWRRGEATALLALAVLVPLWWWVGGGRPTEAPRAVWVVPLQIMAIMHNHYANLAKLDGAEARSEADAMAATGIKSAFPAKKALQTYNRLGAAATKRAIELLAQADLDLRHFRRRIAHHLSAHVGRQFA